jgi:hypothetical protein
VAAALAPGGRMFFADDAYRTPDELIEGESSSTIQRRLNDGTAHRVVKPRSGKRPRSSTVAPCGCL